MVESRGCDSELWLWCRNAEGEIVGMEDATGVVRTLSGTAVGHVGTGGEVVALPGAGGGAAAATVSGWTLDQSTRALVDGDGRMLGTAVMRHDSREAGGWEGQHGVAAGAAAAGLNVMEGVREDLGLLWGDDGTVVGSSVARVAAGMPVVSTAGKVLGDVRQDGTVVGKTGVLCMLCVWRGRGQGRPFHEPT